MKAVLYITLVFLLAWSRAYSDTKPPHAVSFETICSGGQCNAITEESIDSIRYAIFEDPNGGATDEQIKQKLIRDVQVTYSVLPPNSSAMQLPYLDFNRFVPKGTYGIFKLELYMSALQVTPVSLFLDGRMWYEVNIGDKLCVVSGSNKWIEKYGKVINFDLK